MKITIGKPKNYKSHFIVNDPNPKLVISFDNTFFQKVVDISRYEWREYSSEETDTLIIITELKD